jgi:hypothetical protein
VFEALGSILMEINGNVSFTLIIFLFKHSPIFDHTSYFVKIKTEKCGLFLHNGYQITTLSQII